MYWDFFLALLLHVMPFATVGANNLTPAAPEPVGLAAPIVDSISVGAFAEHHALFAVQFGDTRNDFNVMAMFVLPRDVVPVTVSGAAPGTPYNLRASGGQAMRMDAARWSWVAPAKPGLYPIAIQNAQGDSMTLNVFVMVPYERMRGGVLDGYRIGAYPRTRTGFEDAYVRPRGFVQVTPELEAAQVSPHFTLGQFVCKEAGNPRYVVLREPLFVKLENLLAAVNARGIEAYTFAVMSAYRTPVYNSAIGNVTTFSRHQYGDAADIYVDNDGDGRMDDLNHDGRHTEADAKVLGAIVNATQDDGAFAGLTGGLGMYAPTEAHGPFVHVDVRGFAARWGS
jgi:hypothetical protein